MHSIPCLNASPARRRGEPEHNRVYSACLHKTTTAIYFVATSTHTIFSDYYQPSFGIVIRHATCSSIAPSNLLACICPELTWCRRTDCAWQPCLLCLPPIDSFGGVYVLLITCITWNPRPSRRLVHGSDSESRDSFVVY
jgi:hypothetical protein